MTCTLAQVVSETFGFLADGMSSKMSLFRVLARDRWVWQLVISRAMQVAQGSSAF